MPRTARIVAPGVAHHAVQRGNKRQDVFFVDHDRSVRPLPIGRLRRKTIENKGKNHEQQETNR